VNQVHWLDLPDLALPLALRTDERAGCEILYLARAMLNQFIGSSTANEFENLK
jgi:hypothetical protein